MSELNMKFMTPTVNLFFSAGDFVKFCENLPYYLNQNLFYIRDSESGYPIVGLDDLVIEAVHYTSFESFKETWERRKTRVNYKKLFMIFTDRDGFKPQLLDRISKIPYKKVLFSNKDYPEYGFVCKVQGFEGQDSVGLLTDFEKKGLVYKRLYWAFSFIPVFESMSNEK